MNRRDQFLLSLLLVSALIVPMRAAAYPKQDRQENSQRIYDKDHKDYHNWDNSEDREWRQYQSDHHQDYRDFSKASKRQQSAYWNWRHAHPD
jgi:hypothetical protein